VPNGPRKATFTFFTCPVDIIDQGWQLQPTGGPHNSLRTRLRAELVYAHIEDWGLNWLERRYLQTVRLKSRLNDKAVVCTELTKTQRMIGLL
jgi:hypothetical protein